MLFVETLQVVGSTSDGTGLLAYEPYPTSRCQG